MSSYLPKAAVFALAGGMALLSGCGLGTLATNVTPEAVSGIQIDGTAFGGSTAISGATVKLYVSGTTGYGSAPTYSATASAKTAAGTGAFSFSPAFATSSCTAPASQIVYLTVTGGDPTGNDASGGTNNHAILMASVLGTCSNLTNAASLHVAINEATTVAAAYALSGFSTVTSSAGGLASLNIGAPSTNTQGLLDAAANALLLVTSSSTTAGAAGNANASTAAVLLPTAALNTIANSITPCVNASEYNVPPCSGTGGLFALTTPPGGSAPTNVYQATLNIATYPGQNVAAIMQLGPGVSPFQPNLAVSTVGSTTAPNDLTLGIAYPNATFAVIGQTSAPISIQTGAGLAIDNSDNVWVTGIYNGTSTSTYNYVAELTNPSTGASYNANLGSVAALDGTHTIRNATFDTLGNFWLSDKNATGGSLIEIPAGSSSINSAVEQTAFSATLDPNDWMPAVDANNNVWTVSYGAAGNCTTGTAATTCAYVEYQKSGSTYTPVNTFGSPAAVVNAPTVRGIAADAVANSPGLGNIWSTSVGIFGGSTAGTSAQVLTPSTGALSTYTLGSTAGSPLGIGLDNTGGAYLTTSATLATSGLWYVPQGTATSTVSSTVATTGTGLASIPTVASAPVASATTKPAVGGLNTPGYIALDGTGNVWVANNGYGTVVEYSPSLTGFLSPYYGFAPSLNIPGETLNITALTVVAGTAGTVNVYNTQNNAVVGQTITFPANAYPTGGNYAFLNGNTYTIASGGSSNYFVINTGTNITTGVPKNTAGAATATLGGFTAQSVITCGTTCTVAGNTNSKNNSIAIDRAGTVWTLSGNTATLYGIIGTAAPTNPILAAGQTGVKP